MINKRISKITILTCLMLAGVVNAQEFYTCVPKKSWYNNGNNFPNVNELAEAIAKGIKDSKEDPWSLVSTIDFKKILNDYNLNQNNIPVFNTSLPYGNYKFRLILKSKDKTILKKFENIVNINKNAKLFFDSFFVNCDDNYDLNRMLSFLKKYNLDKIIFLQERDLINLPNCDTYYNIGIGLLRLENKVLFSYENISKWHNIKLYDENFIVNEQINDNNHYWLSQNPLNIFRYSTLEIYKQNDS